MPKICYEVRKFTPSSQRMIDHANRIIGEYANQGYDLTLRQLYYQFVSRDLIPNNQKEYKRLGSIINDARLAGQIDWNSITDRTRNLESNSHWESPASIIDVCARTFRLDLWENQPFRIEVWIEKDALSGVFERICKELDIAYFSCRGYTSQSEMWSAAMRLKGYDRAGQKPVILHFGDHDPSGIDMTRDIDDRLKLFMGGVEVKRLALNMAQVEEHEPPPNPAKITDSRFESYQREHGDESWELDALQPQLLSQLVRGEVTDYTDQDLMDARLEEQAEHRRKLTAVSDQWDKLTRKL